MRSCIACGTETDNEPEVDDGDFDFDDDPEVAALLADEGSVVLCDRCAADPGDLDPFDLDGCAEDAEVGA